MSTKWAKLLKTAEIKESLLSRLGEFFVANFHILIRVAACGMGPKKGS